MIWNKDGTVFSVNEFHDGWIEVVCDLMATASPTVRNEIKMRVERAVRNEDSDCRIDGYCDCSKAVELKGHFWGWNYLYVWLDGQGVPFYVGKGSRTNRIADFKYSTRSNEFQDRVREGGCHAVKVAKHISDKEIDYLEKSLISYLCWRGYPLVNRRDVPDREKLGLWSIFEQMDDNKDIIRTLSGTVKDCYNEWRYCMETLSPIIGVLDEVIGCTWAGECADLTPKTRKPAETLTYNGETLTYDEWGKRIGVVEGSTIRTRVKVCGWDIDRALYTPSAKQKKAR